ncbi:MAG: two pore domain potassium channel family protein [Acidobacteria bacterium]|nr:two pore domain potassium channel family protein [Acidobacteriota bacterium]
MYSCLTVHGHGVDKPGLGFLDGIYFSIVTVTSLGYGDISPVGLSRLIVGLEVLFGLAIMGIMIAKVTSRRLSYYVQRLFAADAQRYLNSSTDRLDTIRESLNTAEAMDDIWNTVVRLHTETRVLHDYIDLESKQHALFTIISEHSVRRVGTSLEGILSQLTRLLSLPTELRSQANRQTGLLALTTVLDRIALLVLTQCSGQDSLACFRVVRENCKKIRDSLALPPSAVVGDPPSQRVPRDPQPEGGGVGSRR